MTFQSLNVIDPILSALSQQGYEHPTPIQSQAIPIVLRGKDLMGCAQTGTGKTAAFAIPVLQLLNKQPHKANSPIRALVLSPTRELAIQIYDSFNDYGANLKLKSSVIFGGVSQQNQTQNLQKGTDILVATPGRLLDLMNQGYVKLNQLEILVLDEADRMLDMGFIHDIRKVLKAVPQKRQTLFFSATMPDEIVTLSKSMLHHPEHVSVTPVSSTAETVSQTLYHVEKPFKTKLLIHLINDFDIDHALVFARTKHGSDRIARLLNKAGIKAEAIHGDKSQNARQRALSNFKDRTIRVLVATDIAARGIDVDDLSHVFNYDVPNVAETYVHRIGRTGRAGANGIAISLCDTEERAYLKDIQKLIGFSVAVVDGHPFEGMAVPPKDETTNFVANRPKNQQPKQPKSQPEQKKNPNKRWFNRGNSGRRTS